MTTSNWDKFCLLMWKNWRIQWHRKGQLVVELLMPVVFALLLVLVRALVVPSFAKTPLKYRPERIDNLDHLRILLKNTTKAAAVKKWQIAYFPENQFYEKIVGDAARSLNVSFIAIKANSSLEQYIAKEKIIAGIKFFNSPETSNGQVTNLSYALRFPSELRSGVYPEQLTWQTNQYYPSLFNPGPRNKESNDGGPPPGYIVEGFLAIQNAIASSFIRHVANDSNAEWPEIKMQRYPYPPYVNDPLLQGMEAFVPLIILLSFMYSCKYIVKSVTEEKELQLKEVMKIIGISNWLHWTAWFTKSLMLTSVSTVLLVIMLKIRFFPGSSVAVLTQCNFLALFFFLTIYAISCITFCFALSSCFKKSDTAASVVGLMLFLIYMPYPLTQVQYETLTLGQKLGMCLLFNTAMSFGFKFIVMLEGTGEGLQWDNMWKPVNIDDQMHVGHVIVMLLFSSVIHMIIALYVEQILPGDFGVPKKWYFPFTKEFWFEDRDYKGIEDEKQPSDEDMDSFETDIVLKPAGLQIKGLRKVFNDKPAVNGVTMNVYEDEITVLLGHNGAGKTTTISMITGMFPPTSGTAIINGSDIRSHLASARSSLGLCPQHNILFSDLTVKEHIIFYSRLKGIKKNEIDKEIERYVSILELEDKVNVVSSKLSGGMKRKLSIGLALCGGSKVVLLDEPTSGMDPAARRSLWNLVQEEKIGRTILLSTHFMDEADVLGDRIAIMCNGEVKCYGSSFFLKKKFGSGYHLICVKGEGCEGSDVTNLLAKYVPDIKIESEIGTELSYKLPESYSSVFENMLKELEQSSAQLKLNGYGISNTTLEEVFLAVGTQKCSDPTQETEELPDTDSVSSYDPNTEDSAHLLKGPKLVCNQWLAMLLKKALFTIRNSRILIVQNIVPIMFIALTITIYQRMLISVVLPSLFITLDSYGDAVTLLERGNGIQNDTIEGKVCEEYENVVKLHKRPQEFLILNTDFQDYMLNLYETNLTKINFRYLVGSTVTTNGIIAWFNNEALHTAPLSLNLVHNAVARTILGPSVGIEVYNWPLPLLAETRFQLLSRGKSLGFQLAVNLSFCLAFVTAFYILFSIRERVSRAKLLQFVGGVKILVFWISSFIFDYLTFIITALVIIITLLCFQEEGWSSLGELGRTMFILIVFGFAVMPVTYFASLYCDEPVVGFSRLSVVNVFGGMACFITVTVMSFDLYKLKDIADGLTWFFLAFPHFALAHSLNNINIVAETDKICNSFCEMMPDICLAGLKCDFMPQCCSLDYFAWEAPGIGMNILYMLCTGVIFWIILLLIEFRFFEELICNYVMNCTPFFSPISVDGFVDEDVQNEKDRIRNMRAEEIESHNLVLDQVTKYYGHFLAVNQLSVGVMHSECFGLLGVNGAGKTSTFKMLTGDTKITYGEGYVKGKSLRKDMSSVYREIGYCPQFDALLEDLTGRETMQIFCLLRGIPNQKVNKVTKELAKLLGFSIHLDKQIKKYSGGNKRKLSTAIALIGSPAVILLDEPTTGMDPVARRHLWNIVCRVRDSGKSIILTSHSMEECEALCTRLAIMVNGEFKCMGSTQHLKNRFSKGFVLKIKLKKRPELESRVHSTQNNVSFFKEATSMQMMKNEAIREDVERIKSFIELEFPEAALREHYQRILTFHIPTADIKWSRIFGLMENNKSELKIEDYSISQTTLEQIFLDFAKHQRDEFKDPKAIKKKFCWKS